MRISSVKLPSARSGIAPAGPVARAADEAVLAAAARLPARRARADHAAFLPVLLAAGEPAPLLVTAPYLAQRIAQEAVSRPLPDFSRATAYRSAPPAAFEGLNYRTRA